jgi:uncharacterized protein
MASVEAPVSPLQASLSPGIEEELEGPSRSTPEPVRRVDRISSIDALRGFALLGILVLNIMHFAGPRMHDVPVGLPKPAFTGPHAQLNLAVMFVAWAFFEGKMRGLFSILFGAGIVLLTSRAEKRGAGIRGADIYTRRNLWLCLFGILHGTFLWDGDILFHYGLSALLFLFPFRAINVRTQFVLGLVIAVVFSTWQLTSLFNFGEQFSLHRRAVAAESAQRGGQPLSAEQKEALQDWRELTAKHAFTKDKTDEALTEAHAGYFAYLTHTGLGFAKHAVDSYTSLDLCDTVGAMLIGMALFRSGFLTVELSYATYLWTALVGFLVSVPIYVIGIWKAWLAGFDFYTVELWLYEPYELARVAGALAIAAALLIVIKSGLFRTLLRPFAAVGQMALTNYLLTSLLCQLIFLWGPWKLFGQLEFFQYYYVVFGVWAVNLILSTLWLRAFSFGPVEWLWRSLTYWKLQPMRAGGQ